MAGIIPREFIDLLLSKIDIIDVIQTHLSLRKSGNNYFARCPFHQEKSASFSVSHTKQFYYCFGCGASGNAIDFIMQQEHLNFREAIESLAHDVGMEVPQTEHYAKRDQSAQQSVEHLHNAMNQATQYFYEQMRASNRAIEYLKQRGITGQIAQEFRIGYAPNHWHALENTLAKNAQQKQTLLALGLLIKKSDGSFYDRFRDRIMFPITNHRGKIIGFGGRIIDAGEPKYLNSPETIIFQKSQTLYGLYQALKANHPLKNLLIVEGYMDVIALFQHGINYAVATLGTATSAQHLERLLRFTDHIIFCFDGDAAGKNAAWRALQIIFPLMHEKLDIRFLFLPDGEDPDSLIRKKGKAYFENLYKTASSLSEFFFAHLCEGIALDQLEGRARFADSALKYIQLLPTDLFRNMMMQELSLKSRIDLKQLNPQKAQADRTHFKQNNQDAPLFLDPIYTKALALLLQKPELAQCLTDPLPPLKNKGFLLLKQCIEIMTKNPHISTGQLIEYWRDTPDEKIILSLVGKDIMIPDAGMEFEFQGVIRQITLMGLDEEINGLLAKAANKTLDEEEKIILSTFIARKKDLSYSTS